MKGNLHEYMPPSPFTSVSEQTRRVLEWLRDFTSRNFDPAEAESRRHIPTDVFLHLGAKGLLALQVPVSEGGLGLPTCEALHVMEHLGAVDISLAACVAVQNYLSGIPIRRHGTMAVRQAFIPEVISGRCLVAYALTEPSGGSDPRRILSRARLLKDGRWEFTGRKIWSGMAAWAGAFCTFGYAYDEQGRSLGMTGFLIDAVQDGVTCGQETLTMGMRGMVRNEVSFDRAIVDGSRILGQIGRGRMVARETMSLMRLFMSAIALGAAKRALRITLRYVQSRKISSGRMAENPIVLGIIDRATSLITCMECLLDHTAKATDRGEAGMDDLFLACKIIVSEWAGTVIDYAMQLAGGRGYVEANELPRLFRDIRAFRIIEGPTETLACFLGGALMINSDRFRRMSLFQSEPDVFEVILAEQKEVAKDRGGVETGSPARSEKLLARYRLGRLLALGCVAAATSEAAKQDATVARTHAREYALARFAEYRMFGGIAAQHIGVIERAQVATSLGGADDELFPQMKDKLEPGCD